MSAGSSSGTMKKKEYADKLDEIRLENAKLVALTGSNTFAVKKMLSVDDLTSNYVVYSPHFLRAAGG